MPAGPGTPLGGSNGVGTSLPEQVVNSALQYQVAKPLVEAIMKDAGLSNGGFSGISHALTEMAAGKGSSDASANAQVN